jgi:hypothetical protein
MIPLMESRWLTARYADNGWEDDPISSAGRTIFLRAKKPNRQSPVASKGKAVEMGVGIGGSGGDATQPFQIIGHACRQGRGPGEASKYRHHDSGACCGAAWRQTPGAQPRLVVSRAVRMRRPAEVVTLGWVLAIGGICARRRRRGMGGGMGHSPLAHIFIKLFQHVGRRAHRIRVDRSPDPRAVHVRESEMPALTGCGSHRRQVGVVSP